MYHVAGTIRELFRSLFAETRIHYSARNVHYMKKICSIWTVSEANKGA